MQISILGCGWLGFPLAKSLLANGFSVHGSTTSWAKMGVLKNAGILPFQLFLFENTIEGPIDSFLENSQILILDIPPKLRGDSKENFVGKIQTLLPFIEKSSVEKVLFVSSTAVYADDNSTIDEQTKPNPTTESGKQLLAAENLLQNHSAFQTTVVRFGGLIGADRHPIHFLSGREGIENPEAPINLIHLEDCIGIIQSIIQSESWNEVFNAVAPHHPTRKDYYTHKANGLNLPLPEFDDSKASVGKTILSEKITTVLNYEFKNDLL